MGYNEGIGKVWLSTHDAVGQIVAAKTCGRLINLAVGIRLTVRGVRQAASGTSLASDFV